MLLNSPPFFLQQSEKRRLLAGSTALEWRKEKVSKCAETKGSAPCCQGSVPRGRDYYYYYFFFWFTSAVDPSCKVRLVFLPCGLSLPSCFTPVENRQLRVTDSCGGRCREEKAAGGFFFFRCFFFRYQHSHVCPCRRGLRSIFLPPPIPCSSG